MAFETGSATDMNDLMDKLRIFALAQSWVIDEHDVTDDRRLSMHKDSVYVHHSWNQAQADHIGLTQSLGWISAGTDPWNHTDDSGNGPSTNPSVGGTEWNATSGNFRHIHNIGAGPYTSYHFFEDDGVVPYIHCVVEYGANLFRHWGFGELERHFDFTGGEYVYGHVQNNNNPAAQESLIASNASSSSSVADRHATVHVEGLPNQDAAGKWGTVAGITSLGSPWQDRAGEDQIRLQGGSPSGPVATVYNNLPSNAGDGFVPLVPIKIWHRDLTPSPNHIYYLGQMRDIRICNIGPFDPKATIALGGDTWQLFPLARKQNLDVGVDESENFGIAYRQVT